MFTKREREHLGKIFSFNVLIPSPVAMTSKAIFKVIWSNVKEKSTFGDVVASKEKQFKSEEKERSMDGFEIISFEPKDQRKRSLRDEMSPREQRTGRYNLNSGGNSSSEYKRSEK